MSELEYNVLFDKVHIYKNLIEDPNGFVELLKECEENRDSSPTLGNWEKWSFFGTYMTAQDNFSQQKSKTV